jgi:hypothetical protein
MLGILAPFLVAIKAIGPVSNGSQKNKFQHWISTKRLCAKASQADSLDLLNQP